MSLLQRLRSVRVVLTLWYTLVLLLAFAVFGAGVYMYLERLLIENLEKDLVEEVNWIGSLIDVELARAQPNLPMGAVSADLGNQIALHFAESPRNYVVGLTAVDGRVIYRSNQGFREVLLRVEAPSDQAEVLTLLDGDGKPVRGAMRRVGQFVIRVAYPESVGHNVLKSLLSIFALLVPVALFVAIAGGWVMAGVVLRPIGQITRIADRITAENLNQRIPVRKVDDELGRLINTINGMIARVQSSFDNIRQFSLSVAHELKTPLTILKGESELAISKSLSAAEAQDLAATYLAETVRLARIVDDLLTLAKAEAGQMTLLREAVHVDAMMSELYEDATILAVDKGLRIELPTNEPATVMGDPLRLRQLFRALVSNAVRYTDPGGTVRLSCSCEGPHVRVDVQDTGMGIPSESLPKIFDRFYRVDEARSRAKGGSGLGLSIAKWIAESHGGSISVQSALGQGTTFTVFLPRV